ncbi:TPA: hypothetical protein ACW6D3_001167 [Legionella pneumophila]
MNFIEYSKELKEIKPAQEVFVAFLDILGFSDFVRKNTHDNLIAIYQSFFRPIIDMSLTEAAEQITQNSSWIEQIQNANTQEFIAPKLDNVTINCLTISDSIILSTNGNLFTDFLTLLTTVRNLMARSLYFGFPLRGAITHGKLTLDGKTTPENPNIIHHQMLGLPIVEAASLEKSQLWSGCAIDATAAEKIGPNLMRLDPVFLTLYEVPIKNKDKKIMPVVNWVQGISDNDKPQIDARKIREGFSAHGKDIDSNVEEIISNTIDFFKEMTSHPVYKNEISSEDYWDCIVEVIKSDFEKSNSY